MNQPTCFNHCVLHTNTWWLTYGSIYIDLWFISDWKHLHAGPARTLWMRNSQSPLGMQQAVRKHTANIWKQNTLQSAYPIGTSPRLKITTSMANARFKPGRWTFIAYLWPSKSIRYLKELSGELLQEKSIIRVVPPPPSPCWNAYQKPSPRRSHEYVMYIYIYMSVCVCFCWCVSVYVSQFSRRSSPKLRGNPAPCRFETPNLLKDSFQVALDPNSPQLHREHPKLPGMPHHRADT